MRRQFSFGENQDANQAGPEIPLVGFKMTNAFFFGDNLHILREYIPDESVDLIYLDPPFNSNATYNLLFKSPDKSRWPDAQIETFEDTWRWNESSELIFDELIHSCSKVGETIRALRQILGANDMMAYLTMMAVRLVELHRVLRPSGSFYLHCDPTASHYLKILIDAVFGAQNFKNEITWKRTTAHSDGRRFGRNTDSILFFSKSDKWTWNQLYTDYDPAYKTRFKHADPDGRNWTDDNLTAKGLSGGGYEYTYKGYTSLWRVPLKTMQKLELENRLYFTRTGGIRLKRYLDESKGIAVQALWDEFQALNSQSKERLGYPTQKPLALLERIIQASSNEGDVVLDPFCGCGTSIHAAQSLNREWLGIDVAVQAMHIIRDRLKHHFPGISYKTFGLPTDMRGAQELADIDKFKFEEWAVSLVGGVHSGRFRGDKGVDGFFYFATGREGEESRGIISVKGGRNLNPSMIRDLRGTLDRERVLTNDPRVVAVFLSLHEPTSKMREEALEAGFVDTDFRKIPALQILTIEDVFNGKGINVPFQFDTIAAARAGKKRRASKGNRQVSPEELVQQRQFMFGISGGKQVRAEPELDLSLKEEIHVMPPRLKRA